MEEDKRLFGLKYARNLNFTDAQYEEALKKIDSPDPNQLLAALIDVSSRGDTCYTTTATAATSRGGSVRSLGISSNRNSLVATDRTGFISSHTQNSSRESLSPSCYASLASFPSPSSSSTDQPFESHQSPYTTTLRKIYIDGSNVARTHSKNGAFSWQGIKLCVDWFYSRQHRVKVFVPTERCHNTSSDEAVLNYLYNIDALVETPTGCNDDLFVIEAARRNCGVIVSNDLFRDEKRFNDELQRFIYLNRLPYVFVDDLFIPANDPRGRSGPTLDEFLRDRPDQSSSSAIVTGNINNNQQHQHQKLVRCKTYQRYQRNGYVTKNNQSTRSLPDQTGSSAAEQTRANVNDFVQPLMKRRQAVYRKNK